MHSKIKYYLIVFFILLFVLLLCAEYFVRTTAPALNKKDDLVGWRLIKNLDLKFEPNRFTISLYDSISIPTKIQIL